MMMKASDQVHSHLDISTQYPAPSIIHIHAIAFLKSIQQSFAIDALAQQVLQANRTDAISSSLICVTVGKNGVQVFGENEEVGLPCFATLPCHL